MLEHARNELPDECVGLLFGKEGGVRRRVPLANVAARPETHFFAQPEALLAALQEADGRGETFLALYHSHPNGPPTPSATDLAEARYGVVHLVVVPSSGVVRAFEFSSGGFEELALVVLAG